MGKRRNDEERHAWVLNDEGLYRLWQASRMPIRKFVRENREKIDEVIDNIENGQEVAHYLAYGKRR